MVKSPMSDLSGEQTTENMSEKLQELLAMGAQR